MGEQIKLAVIDIDLLHIQAICKAVSPAIQIHAIAGGDLEGVLEDKACPWNLCLFSLDMDGFCVRRLLSVILNKFKEMPIVCYSKDDGMTARIRSGIPIPCLNLNELILYIEAVKNGIHIVDHRINIVEIQDSPDVNLLRQLNVLSPREWDIFCLFSKGYGVPEIATLFNCGISTVETHVRNLRGKLQMDNSMKLRRFAMAVSLSGHCRAFAHGPDHICQERKASVGTCPHVRFW